MRLDCLFGTQIKTSPLCDVPKVPLLSDHCPCSDSVRKEFNAWLIQRFGVDRRVYMIDSKALGMHRDSVMVMSPLSLARLQNLG